MRRLINQVSRVAVKSVACSVMLLAAACGGSERTQTETAAQSSAQREPAGPVAEKPFAAGGRIEMQLEAGKYTVRAARDSMIRVTLGSNDGSPKVEMSTEDAHARVVVKDTPRKNFEATIDVPPTADLVIRLTAGDLTVEAITGSKDVESNAGNVDIVTGDSTDYASVDVSVRAGDIKADPFGGSRSGLLQTFTWSGKGKYAVRARLIAGNLTLRSR